MSSPFRYFYLFSTVSWYLFLTILFKVFFFAVTDFQPQCLFKDAFLRTVDFRPFQLHELCKCESFIRSKKRSPAYFLYSP